MADPIMDLFDDPNLFGLDPLPPEELVTPPAPPPSDPLAEALGLSGALDPPPPPDPPQDPSPNPAPPPSAQPPPDQEVLSQGNPFMGVSAPPPPAPAPPPKIVILKAPPPAGPTPGGPAPLATPNGGKLTLAGGVAKGGVAGQGRQVKQLLLQPLKAGGGASPGTPLKPGLSLGPAQGESKRITLVLQQPPGAAAAPGQRHVVLGTLPGKLLLQGATTATATPAKAAPGAPAKVVTIQLQVQPPAAGQPGQPGQAQKIQLVQHGPGGAGPLGVAQVPQVMGGAGQRLTVPLKVVLQPQPASSAGAAAASSAGLSVVKVLSSSGAEMTTALTATTTPLTTRCPSDESRKLEHQKKQEKANRIVAEAIARARARGEQNIPRVLNEDELPSVRPDDDGDRRRRRKGNGDRAAKEERSRRKGQGTKSKGRGKASTITPVVGKKRKRNASSDNSDSEALPAPSPRRDDDGGVQKRRSNRQVKRKKYTEDLDIKLTDDEEDEELDVTGPARPEGPHFFCTLP